MYTDCVEVGKHSLAMLAVCWYDVAEYTDILPNFSQNTDWRVDLYQAMRSAPW